MIKKASCLLILSLSVFLTACEGKTGASPVGDQPTQQAEENTQTDTEPTQEADKPEADDTEADDPAQSESNDAWAVPDDVSFNLTPEQRTEYDEYIKNADIGTLKGSSPLDVAKIYIQCGIDGNWEAEYNLYAQQGITMTKDEWRELNDVDVGTLDLSTRQSQANYIFPFLQDGQVEEEADTCIITFHDAQEREITFKLLKNEDGIWLVKFNPFD